MTYEIQFHGVGLASSGDASEEGGSSAGGVAVDGSEGMKKIVVGTDFTHHQTCIWCFTALERTLPISDLKRHAFFQA